MTFSYYKLVILLYYNVVSPQAWLRTLVAELKLQSLVDKFRLSPSSGGCDLVQPLVTFGPKPVSYCKLVTLQYYNIPMWSARRLGPVPHTLC